MLLLDSVGAGAVRHAGKVARIAAALRARSAAGPSSGDARRPPSLRKRSASHEVPRAGAAKRRKGGDRLDIGDLDEILDIDPIARTCTAEAAVTFVDLVRATLRYGLVPQVVPE